MDLPQEKIRGAADPVAPYTDASYSRPREIVHGDIAWTVYEDARTTAPTYRKTLVFVSSLVARRVRHYPLHWRTLSDMELLAVSDRA